VASVTRLRSDYLLTLVDEPEVIEDGMVEVEDGRVVWSGPAASAPRSDVAAEQVSGLLMPGMVDTHAHSPMVLLRGAGEGLPVDRWLTDVMWPREGRLTPDDVRCAMTLGAAELLTGGVTTSHEMYFHTDAVVDAVESSGIRAVVTPPILIGDDLAAFGPWQEQLAGIGEAADRHGGSRRVSIGIGPHSAYALPEETLVAVADLARERGLHVHIHLAEGQREGDAVTRRTGLSVPAYLSSLGLLEGRSVLAHGVWLTPPDIDLLSGHDTGVAHCPMSNGKHASGIAPVGDLRGAGVPVAIATDGPSSHDRLDLFEEMRAAIHMARLRAGDAAAMRPADAIAMVTREAGTVLGRPDLGTLGPGSRADIVRIDTGGFVPLVEPGDVVTHLVYSGTPGLVRDVWVEGERVVADGAPTRVDLAGARREATRRARRLAEVS
jgi:5-methylthioadenosine/S-adenosylhomocysteine deaminase